MTNRRTRSGIDPALDKAREQILDHLRVLARALRKPQQMLLALASTPTAAST